MHRPPGLAQDEPRLLTRSLARHLLPGKGGDQRHAPISTQYRRLGTDPSRPAARFSKTPPQFSMTLAEPTLSSSQVTSTRSRPIDDATVRDWRMMAVA